MRTLQSNKDKMNAKIEIRFQECLQNLEKLSAAEGSISEAAEWSRD
jgi:hypothetical protein